MSDATLCHYCETNTAADYPCCSCGLPVCDECIEPMTQFNAGYDLPSLECVNRREASDRRERDKEHAREEAKRARAAKAAATRRTPKAIAKREAKMAEKRERIAAEHRRIDEAALRRIEEFMGHFKYLKERR